MVVIPKELLFQRLELWMNKFAHVIKVNDHTGQAKISVAFIIKRMQSWVADLIYIHPVFAHMKRVHISLFA